MKKADLVGAVYEMHGALTWKEAEAVVDVFLDLVKEAVVQEGLIKLHGFGTLKVVERRGKTGVHPGTGEAVRIRPRKSVVFRVSAKEWGREPR
ncbi:MAG: HU family DNA-binding protein [Acidobacteria bacterium]|nr:HU family DNA-binding protein [Acidobacteriota bacterium]